MKYLTVRQLADALMQLADEYGGDLPVVIGHDCEYDGIDIYTTVDQKPFVNRTYLKGLPGTWRTLESADLDVVAPAINSVVISTNDCNAFVRDHGEG